MSGNFSPEPVITDGELLSLPMGLRWLRKLAIPHKHGVLDRLYGARLTRQGTGFVETACGVLWKLDLTNLNHRWIVYGDYGGGFVSWARSWLSEKPGVVIDSGANIGQTVIYFASVLGTRVFAFEPIQGPARLVTELSFSLSGVEL